MLTKEMIESVKSQAIESKEQLRNIKGLNRRAGMQFQLVNMNELTIEEHLILYRIYLQTLNS